MATAQVSRSDSVLAALRAATTAAHAELDSKLALHEDSLTHDRYRLFLRASMAVVAPLEARIACWLGLSSDGFCRTTALRADLAALDASDTGTAPVPSIHSLAEAMGAAYVVEGSALRAVVLSKTVARTLGDDVPRRYLSLRGDQTGVRWREFIMTLEQWGTHAPPHAHVIACESARATFAAYASAFAAVGALV